MCSISVNKNEHVEQGDKAPGAAAHPRSFMKNITLKIVFRAIFNFWHWRKIPFQSSQLYNIGNESFFILILAFVFSVFMWVWSCEWAWYKHCVFYMFSINNNILCKSIFNHIHTKTHTRARARVNTHDKTITALTIFCKYWANPMCKFKHHVNNDWKHHCKRTSVRGKRGKKRK